MAVSLYNRYIITGPPNGPILFCWLSSVVVVCKARSTLAALSKQHCRSNRQQSNFVAGCFDDVAVLGNNVEATFDFVERTKFQRKTRSTLLPFLSTKSNVASTLLLVWTGLNAAGHRERGNAAGGRAGRPQGARAVDTARRASRVTSCYGDTLLPTALV